MVMTDGDTAMLFEAWQAVPSEHRRLMIHPLRKMGEACELAGGRYPSFRRNLNLRMVPKVPFVWPTASTSVTSSVTPQLLL